MPDEETHTDAEAPQLDLQQFAQVIGDQFKTVLEGMGLDKVDRKHAVFPDADDESGEGRLKTMTKEARMHGLVKAIVNRDHVEAKALSEGTDNLGGYTVPTEFRAELIRKIENLGFMRSDVALKPVGTDAGTQPAVSGGVSVEIVSENAAITETAPSFKQVAYVIRKLAGYTPLSVELEEDTAIDLWTELTDMYAIAIGQKEDDLIWNGLVSSGEPEGILTATGINTDTQAGANLVYDDLIDTLYRAPAVLRKAKRLKWYLSTQALTLIDKLKDDENKPLFRERISTDVPPTLLAFPYEEQPYLPEDSSGDLAGKLALIDPKCYYLFDRRNITIKTTDQSDTAFRNDQIWFKVTERWDGRVAVPDAMIVLTQVR